MKIIPFIIPAIASLLPRQDNYYEVAEPIQNNSDGNEVVQQENVAERKTILRKFDDSHRFLQFARHSSHSSHRSHSSHSSHSSGSSSKHRSHSSHSSGSGTKHYSHTSGSSNNVYEERSTNSTTTKNTTTESSTPISLTLKVNVISDTSVSLTCDYHGFLISNESVEIYQNGKVIKTLSLSRLDNYEIEGLKHSTSYTYYVVFRKKHKSNVVTIKTKADPYLYNKNNIGINIPELKKATATLVSSITDTIEPKEKFKIFVADFYSAETYNAKGRETTSMFEAAFGSDRHYEVKKLSAKTKDKMMRSGGCKNYTEAIAWGKEANATIVCYGTVEKKEGENKYKITAKVIDIAEENILTIKESVVSAK